MLEKLKQEIKACSICADDLALGPRPVVQIGKKASILVIGQAPGTRVHASGIPFDDKSGDRLRDWMGLSREQFYDPEILAIVPMGFCYPGKGKSGDLPPRKECAPFWHERILSALPNIRLTLLIGKYAQERYLGASQKRTLTETVHAFREYPDKFIPLVHPSPRNYGWMKKNAWFEEEVVPYLREKVAELI